MGTNKVKFWQLEHHLFLKLRIKSYSNLISLALLYHTTLWPLLGKTPPGRASICLSYRTFMWEENTSNILISIFWSLNRKIYQGVWTLAGQQKNLFCCLLLKIYAFARLPQWLSTSCKHFTFTFACSSNVSHCSLCKLHGKFPPVQPFGKDPFPLQTEQIPFVSWKERLPQNNLSLFQLTALSSVRGRQRFNSFLTYHLHVCFFFPTGVIFRGGTGGLGFLWVL